jgi:hypothetical protein
MARHRQKPTQRAINEPRRKSRSSRNKFVPPRTVEEYFAMSARDQERWKNVDQTITEVRAGASLRQASRKFGLDPRTVRRLAPSAFRKLKNGRYAAKASDRLLRVLVIPTPKGLSEIGVSHSHQATLLGKYWTAVDRYRDTGDASALREFRGKRIVNASGKRVPLLTDPQELDRLASAGVLSFESIYARAA